MTTGILLAGMAVTFISGMCADHNVGSDGACVFGLTIGVATIFASLFI